MKSVESLAPITAVSSNRIVSRILIQLCAQNRQVTTCEDDLSCQEVYEESLPFDFMQSFYTAL